MVCENDGSVREESIFTVNVVEEVELCEGILHKTGRLDQDMDPRCIEHWNLC